MVTTVMSRTYLLALALTLTFFVSSTTAHRDRHSGRLQNVPNSPFSQDSEHQTHAPLPATEPTHTPIPLPVFAPNDAVPNPWLQKYADVAPPVYANFPSFAGVPARSCLKEQPGEEQGLDIAIVGFPFDNLVSFRPGARFGPSAIRSASRRMSSTYRKYSLFWAQDAFRDLAITDCWDIPLSPFDPSLAIDQMEAAYETLLNKGRNSSSSAASVRDGAVKKTKKQEETLESFSTSHISLTGQDHPKIISLGGDHTIVLPILRSLHRRYGPITVIHLDSHLDTWPPLVTPGGSPTEQSEITHGSFFHRAALEGLMAPTGNLHIGIRSRMSSEFDLAHDEGVGFKVITTEDFDYHPVSEILETIRAQLPANPAPIYLSLDIDVLDPSLVPGTGTIEGGGFTMREIHQLLRGLGRMGLDFVGADVVELLPMLDNNAETSALTAAEVVYEMINLMVRGNRDRKGQAAADEEGREPQQKVAEAKKGSSVIKTSSEESVVARTSVKTDGAGRTVRNEGDQSQAKPTVMTTPLPEQDEDEDEDEVGEQVYTAHDEL